MGFNEGGGIKGWRWVVQALWGLMEVGGCEKDIIERNDVYPVK